MWEAAVGHQGYRGSATIKGRGWRTVETLKIYH